MNPATTQDALARIRARLAALDERHAESMLDPSERGGAARSAASDPVPAGSAEQGQNAPGDSDRQTSVAGAARPSERQAGNTLNGREILELDAATVAALHPDLAAPALANTQAPGAATSSEHVGPAVDDVLDGTPESAGADREPADLAVALGSPDLIDDGVGVVLPFERPAPALPPEPVESPKDRLARRTAETEARMGVLRAEGRAKFGGRLPPAWAAVAGTELARSTEAPPAADAVYARAGPNRCAPSSPWADFDRAA